MAQDRSPESSSDHNFLQSGSKMLIFTQGSWWFEKEKCICVFTSQHKHPSKLQNCFPYIYLYVKYVTPGAGAILTLGT